MAGDNALFRDVHTQELADTLTDVAVARSMETVATHVVLLVQVIRDGIEISVGRHRAVESIVEDRHLRRVRHKCVDSTDTAQVAQAVYRGEVDQALNALLHLRRDEATLLEEVAALHHAVADSVDLVEVLDGADLRIEQTLEDQGHTLLMGRQVGHDLLLASVGQLHLDKSLVEADTLYATLGKDALAVHVVELVLDRTATAVENQYFHVR